MAIKRVALLTAGGFAPCLSSAVASLIEFYTEQLPEVEIIAYQHGYHGLLSNNKIVIDETGRKNAHLLHSFGGSPIGNSRVKLTNTEDLVQRGLVAAGDNPLEVGAKRLQEDGVDVLHTIGGDDTNTTAADLAQYLEEHGYHITVVGLPKTIDNDVIPIAQSLGAQTAASEASKFAQNIISEHRSNPRMLIIHEIMGRHCGWLAAAAARDYRQWWEQQTWAPELGLDGRRWDIHALFLPELALNIEGEAARLKAIMDDIGNVNIFLSEGAGVSDIVEQLEASGVEVERDPFGHVKLDTINPGEWFAKQFAELLGAEKVMVQKSGYFSRSAPANETDRKLIAEMCKLAVQAAKDDISGVVGHDEDRDNELRVIEFDRIAGGKAFAVNTPWFTTLMSDINQPVQPAKATN